MWTDLSLVAVLLASLVGLWALQRRASSAGSDLDQFVTRGLDSSATDITGVFKLARQAGIRPMQFLIQYLPFMLVLGLLLPLAYVNLFDRTRPLWLLLLLTLLGLSLPALWLLVERQQRRDRIQRSISYLLDLVVAFLAAGLSLEEAVRRAGRDGFQADHPLGHEVTLMSRELDSGRDRAAAFHALAERTGVRDLIKVASALRLGLKLGAPIQGTLEAQADLFRVKRREDGLRRINRAQVAAVFPVVLCGLPILLVLIFFPAVIELLSVLGSLGDLL